MFRTWNHLAWRRAARASRHFCLSKTSAGSFTIPEVTSKNGFEVSKWWWRGMGVWPGQRGWQRTNTLPHIPIGFFHDNLQLVALFAISRKVKTWLHKPTHVGKYRLTVYILWNHILWKGLWLYWLNIEDKAPDVFVKQQSSSITRVLVANVLKPIPFYQVIVLDVLPLSW